MKTTEYENGVLICSIHRTPINKSHGRFFCLKCQRGADKMETIAQTHKTATEHLELLITALDALHDLESHNFYASDHYRSGINSIRNDIASIKTFLDLDN